MVEAFDHSHDSHSSTAATTSLEAARASRLVDQLFDEFEATLEQPAQPSSRVSLALQAAQRFDLAADEDLEQSVASLVSPPEALLVPYTPLVKPHPTQQQQPTTPTTTAAITPAPVALSDRWLITLACSSLLIAIGLWLVSQWQPTKAPVATVIPASPAPAISSEDQVFAEYLLRSLQMIQTQPQTPQTAPPAVAVVPTPAQNQPAQAPPTPAITERIYIPVYQPAAPPGPAVTSPLPAPSPVAIASPTQTKPKPETAPPLMVAKPQQTLVGVLELGDRSVALLSMDGATRRVQIGEPVDPTGWKLVQIANQKAVVQRGGEVRSIYVGQQF